MKSKKHQELEVNWDISKRKHLDKLATKMLKNDDKFTKLKEKQVNKKFLDLF
jgi:hypothetical protein